MNHFADAKPATLMTRGDVIRLAFEVVSMGAGRESAATTECVLTNGTAAQTRYHNNVGSAAGKRR